MAVTPPILVDNAGAGVVQATLTDTATGNCLCSAMVDALTAALDQAEADPETRVFVIAARGPTFSGGMPLGDPTNGAWTLDPAPVRTLLTRLARSPLITIAIVNGAAVGGGVGLAAACDQVVAGPLGSFQLTEVLLGLIPAVVLPVIATRLGAHQAFSLALTAEKLTAHRALGLGLVDRASQQPQRELRHLLVALRRADASALTALKRYRAELYPPPSHWDEMITNAVRERFGDPRVRHRLAALHKEELIPCQPSDSS